MTTLAKRQAEELPVPTLSALEKLDPKGMTPKDREQALAEAAEQIEMHWAAGVRLVGESLTHFLAIGAWGQRVKALCKASSLKWQSWAKDNCKRCGLRYLQKAMRTFKKEPAVLAEAKRRKGQFTARAASIWVVAKESKPSEDGNVTGKRIPQIRIDPEHAKKMAKKLDVDYDTALEWFRLIVADKAKVVVE